MTLSLLAPLSAARAQDAVLSRGDAVVTGFSGIKPADAPLKPGANPLDEFFIDPNGPSAQILSLAVPGGAPSGQLISAPAKLQLKASQIGQVFATALDDGLAGKVPSIYLGATSAYGLNIVVPDADGDGWPERLKSGQAGAQWMAGQFGTDLGGGPGAIYKVDGQTGTASLFASLPDNSGPGVGDIVFDKANRQFFASDLDKGLIYRLGESGEIIDSFDHGVAGRPAKGLAPVADDGKQADIETPAFNIDNPESWGATQPERRVQGLAVQDGRLYYAVAGQVWSIGISEGFDKDARWELDVQGLPGESQLTDMLFDQQGRLYLAQRGAQRGSYDYSLFAEPEKSAVVRYRREEPDNPATESVWVAEPESYAIGLPPEHNHAEGGIALGHPHDESGALRYGACGEMLWSTGHRLRQSAIAEGGEGEGEADVHGLQGNAVSLVRPQNVPPQQAYFADYDGYFGDAAKAGHMGDVEIWQPCDGVPAQTFGQFPPGIFPPGEVPPDLPPEFPPDYKFETNLELTKRATPKTCSPYLGGWLCQYTIRVTNTGPDNYFGPIMVRDWLPAAPAGALMGFAPTPPWTCWSVGASDNRCVRFGVFLAPGWSVELTAYALVPQAYDKCHLTNAARIEWAPPGSIWNSDPTDDVDFASANIPAPHCKPGDKTDLKIYKVAQGACYPHAGKIRCPYVVGVQNVGLGTYNGVIEVEDTVPAGTTATFFGAPWAPCSPPVGNTYTCTHPGANLASGAFAPLFAVAVDVPLPLAKQMNCKVLNQVEITQAPGGSPQNTDLTNDKADATHTIPAQICEDTPNRSNLKIEKRVPLGEGVACEIGAGKDWCHSFEISVTNTGPGPFNGKIKVTDIVPLGLSMSFIGGPGWSCIGDTCETDAAVTLDKNPPSGDEVRLSVVLEGTAENARTMDCKLRNRAKIDSPLGAPKNTNAADDQDQITVDLPEKFCKRPESNLKIEKKANPKLCEKQGGGWWCTYDIVVTNTGPGVYNHVIELEEALPAEPLDATWNAPWTCEGTGGAGAMCKHPIVEIPVNGTVTLKLRAKFAEDVVKEKQCRLPNVIKIYRPAPGSPINNNPDDDIAGDTALVPEDICKPQPTDLELIKWGAQGLGCNAQNGQWRCPWIVDVKNVGNADYNGKVVVKDWLPAAASGATMQEQGGVWNCVGNAPSVTCTHPATTIKPGQKVFLQMYVFLDPSKYDGCSLMNTARILQAPGGSVQNTNAGNDQQSSVLNFQPLLANGRAYCYSPEPSTPCPPGFRWGGESCERIGITTLPPVRLCPAGSVGRYPDCHPDDDYDPDCRPGTVGEYPNCRPVVDPKCPSGTVGTYPNCRPDDPKCPPGTVGNYPHCRDKPDSSTPECTDGRVRRGSTCVCPGSLVWNGDQCVRRKCPEGMRGTFPNCTKVVIDPPKCKNGTTGRWPNCEKIVKICPAGTVGKYPNCRKIPTHCPSNMTGKPPRCHPIVKVCPSGMVGRPPNCKRKPPKLQQPQRFQKFQKPSFKPNFGQGLRGRPSNLRLR